MEALSVTRSTGVCKALRAPQATRPNARARFAAAQQHKPVSTAAIAPFWQQRRLVAAAAADSASSADPEPEQEGLLPEEDVEVPGNYRDAMSGNTALGQAVRGACDELDALGNLEKQTLEEAEGLLKKLGFKGSLFTVPAQPEGEQKE